MVFFGISYGQNGWIWSHSNIIPFQPRNIGYLLSRQTNVSNKIVTLEMFRAYTAWAGRLPFCVFALNKIHPKFASFYCLRSYIVTVRYPMKRYTVFRIWSVRTPEYNTSRRHFVRNCTCKTKWNNTRRKDFRSRFDVMSVIRTQTLFSRPWLKKFIFGCKISRKMFCQIVSKIPGIFLNQIRELSNSRIICITKIHISVQLVSFLSAMFPLGRYLK